MVIVARKVLCAVQLCAAHPHRAALGPDAAAQLFHFLLHGGNAVRLFHPQPAGVADDGFAVAEQGQHHQDGAQVRAVGQVNVHGVQIAFFKMPAPGHGGHGRAAPAQNVEDHPVALTGVFPQACDRDAAAHRAQHRRKSRLRGVAFHRGTACRIALVSGDEKGVSFPPDVHAEIGHGPQGQGHVTLAFKGRGHVQHAVPLQQRQRQQKTADELAGNTAIHLIFSRLQRAAQSQAVPALVKRQILSGEQPGVHVLRALHQPPVAQKAYRTAAARKQRNEKPQGAAALAAVHRGLGQSQLPAAARDPGAAVFQLHPGAQRPQGPGRGLHVLRGVHPVNDALPFGKAGADQQPVGHAFGRGRSQNAGHFARLNNGFHLTSPGR